MKKLAVVWALLGCLLAQAAPFEVKVHDEWIAPFEKTTFEVETHLYQPSTLDRLRSKPFQTRLELAHGISKHSELAVNAYVSHYDGVGLFNGGKIAHLYAPMHDQSGWLHFGLKNEINVVRPIAGNEETFYEVTPIIAMQFSRWRLTLNPSIDFYFSGDRETVFAPSGRLSFALTGATAFGVEYYSEMGPLNRPTPGSQRPDTTYLVLDTRQHALALHVGIGKGVNAAADDWVFKLIGTFEFN